MCLPMTHNIALPHLSSCLAVFIGAKYLRGIHLFCACFFHSHSLQIDAFSSHPLGLLSTSYPSAVKFGGVKRDRLLETTHGRAFSSFVTSRKHHDILGFKLDLTDEGFMESYRKRPLA